MSRHRKILLTEMAEIVITGQRDPITRQPFRPGDKIVLCEREGGDAPIKLTSWGPDMGDRCPFCGENIDHIDLGDTQLVEPYQMRGSSHPEPHQDISRQGRRSGASYPQTAVLHVFQPGVGARIFNPLPDIFTIGRSRRNHLVLGHNPKISRHHARIVRAVNGRWYLQDHSSNGTFRNRDRIVATELRSGDSIQIEDVNMLFEQ